ncbi:8772_t:CDS:2 [Ambispora gerdemannii]|uniref:8772_t:CDS:1 n=1 Tax=Ambispora gerdemannii TaxID=144530 RepID=A0A9N9AZC4_9GLOM|nr:8772_t:CDS:2 [Ambispora gerdemannii]
MIVLAHNFDLDNVANIKKHGHDRASETVESSKFEEIYNRIFLTI